MSVRSICIIGLDDYPLLAGAQAPGYVGGESVQHVLLARAWRELGLDVSMIVHDHGQGREQDCNGIRAITAHAPQAGAPVLRFVHPRMTGLIAALAAADADVYYQSPAGAVTGVTAWFCRQRGRSFVFRVASDANCIRGRQLIRFWRDRKLYEFGLRRADLIATQTVAQSVLLLQHYGLGSTAVNMAVEPPPQHVILRKDIDALWVSNLRSVKRPEIVLELARQLPQVQFTLAGGAMPGRQDYYDQVMAAAAGLHNVTMLGAVPYAKIGALFDRARLLLNTSSVEGFPNTFLQAWIRSVPVVAFFDPDQMVRRRGLGIAVASPDEMRQALVSLLANQAERERIGERARSFVQTEFAPVRAARRYLELLDARQERHVRDGTHA
jgi:glycosyltransferase involved in cell wall biosynthesis